MKTVHGRSGRGSSAPLLLYAVALDLAEGLVADHRARSPAWPSHSHSDRGGPPRASGLGSGGIQRQYLVEGRFISDEPSLHEIATCLVQGHGVHRQTPDDSGVGVIAEALAVSDGEEKEIQGKRVRITTPDIMSCPNRSSLTAIMASWPRMPRCVRR